MANFQMAVICSECGKENIVDIKENEDTFAKAIMESFGGQKSYHYHGLGECSCGYDTEIIMSVAVGKRDERKLPEFKIPMFGGLVPGL